MTMTKWLVFGALVFAACGGGDKAKMQKMKDAMCECKTRDCVKKVEEDNKEWMMSLKDKYKSKDDVPKDMMDIGEEMDKCKRDARKAEEAKKGSEAMAKMGEFKDKMCACKDKACADGVNKDFEKWGTDMAKDMGAAMPSEDDMKKGAEISKAYGECMAKAMGAP
jgi:hypothetical protein